MKERPILFSGPMVRAILEGRKTQTRRVVTQQPSALVNGAGTITAPGTRHDGLWYWYAGDLEDSYITSDSFRCPYGQPGDRLWVRETISTPMGKLAYQADGAREDIGAGKLYRWIPSIHMPRWASRITLEVTGVRVERLQEISQTDAQAEGARWKEFGRCGSGYHLAGWSMEDPFPESHAYCLNTAQLAFANYINTLHGGANWNLKPSNIWASNPWVWVVEFRRLP